MHRLREANGRALLLGVVGTLFFAAVRSGPAVAAADFSGAWNGEAWSTEGWPTDPPYTAAGRAAQDAYEADRKDDPILNCIQQAVGRMISAPFPHEVIQQEQRITFLYENFHQVRRIWMDGREHPEDEYPTLMGHSIGWWDGDTLVVDTRNVESGYMRPQGLPHTENLHLIERYTLLNGGERKRLEITIEDPEYYREPWTVTKTYARFDDIIRDYVCIPRPHAPGE